MIIVTTTQSDILLDYSINRLKVVNGTLRRNGDTMNFNGKVVLITGGSSGIGAGTAEYLAKLGATLALTGRNAENLKTTIEKCITSEDTPRPISIVGDITNESDAKMIIEKVIETFGRLDVLINNAGIIERGTIENTSLGQYDRVMNTNVRAMYHLTMLAVPHLIASKGNIVNVSSVNGMRSFPGVLAYNISKSAVDQFTRCVALELAAKGVRCNSINPGVIVTDIHRRGGMNDDEYNKFLEHSRTTHALGRPGNVEETAASIAFLASDLASFITAAQLPVDGGRHAMCPR
ncbi:3-oxoacyl-[acyl-carrier-protein] reductase FabG [Pseudolycoriella hygida]|uniref:3-oxoacyl-[acyl-carrier-protein] reductase FabG n=1 Tax=Pseudolycoriella hygida TaxID=35572 RepID=A0A9Q0RXI3_9DIPT|nr:3-oxoacyl-[acyl-carrier-protein] reductase FabG [Pseudolycoriella hygida]